MSLRAMKVLPVFPTLFCGLLFAFAIPGMGQDMDPDFKAKVDAMVSEAYQSAAAQFPCKLKTRGKPKMLHWQQVDKCLNGASDRVDWEGLSLQIQELRNSSRYTRTEIAAAVESSMAAHAMPFEKVFTVKKMEALLPLTNSLLKFMPAESLQGAPVFEKAGPRIGTFSGVYNYEKAGGLTAANRFRMSIFQYTDLKGNMQTPTGPNRLLLDSYGVPWKEAFSQPGFRLNTDRIDFKR